MRELAGPDALERFMDEIGKVANAPTQIFFTGGALAVARGWREATVDLDIRIVPESDRILRELPRLKEKLKLNVELAAPDDFIPPLPQWRERSLFIRASGQAVFFHYDPYAQALSKIERGHRQDVLDVGTMLEEGLVEPGKLVELFKAIEPELYRYPALDPDSFRSAVLAVAAGE
ncbi:MAG: DUF6036 family nucleotidyltransferase [Actinomycetota bacterium]